MTALETPAPDAPAAEWGALAESIPGWRWMPGMRYFYGGFCSSTGASEDYVDRLCEDDAGPYCHAISPTPDPDDYATAGCLLALLGLQEGVSVVVRLREHQGVVVSISMTHRPDGTWWVGERRIVGGWWGDGVTLGRACIAAASALGRWPGGDS